MFKWWKSLSPTKQYVAAMSSALVGAIPLLVCSCYNISPPTWVLLICLAVMANGSCLAYAIRVNNT